MHLIVVWKHKRAFSRIIWAYARQKTGCRAHKVPFSRFCFGRGPSFTFLNKKRSLCIVNPECVCSVHFAVAAAIWHNDAIFTVFFCAGGNFLVGLTSSSSLQNHFLQWQCCTFWGHPRSCFIQGLREKTFNLGVEPRTPALQNRVQNQFIHMLYTYTRNSRELSKYKELSECGRESCTELCRITPFQPPV